MTVRRLRERLIRDARNGCAHSNRAAVGSLEASDGHEFDPHAFIVCLGCGDSALVTSKDFQDELEEARFYAEERAKQFTEASA